MTKNAKEKRLIREAARLAGWNYTRARSWWGENRAEVKRLAGGDPNKLLYYVAVLLSQQGVLGERPPEMRDD